MVLRSWGINIPRPIVLLTEMNPVEVANALCVWAPVVVPNSASKHHRREILTTMISELPIFHFDGTDRSKTMVRQVADAFLTSMVDEKELTCCPIIVSTEMISHDVLGSAFYVELGGSSSDRKVDFTEIIPEVEDFPVVRERMEEYQQHKGMAKLLHAAVCFLHPKLKLMKMLDICDELHRCVDEMVEVSESMTDLEGVDEIFLRQLFKWLEERESVPHAYLPEVHTDVLQRKDSFIFLNDYFAYMSNIMFREITKPIISIIGVNGLKKALSLEGILVCGIGNTYTSKMAVCDQYGKERRLDMLRFKLDRLSIYSKPDFSSYFGGEGHDF